MKNYLTEHKEYDENYDDIYPSIVKRQPSYFKNVFLRLSFCFKVFGTGYVIQRNHEVARNNRTLKNRGIVKKNT